MNLRQKTWASLINTLFTINPTCWVTFSCVIEKQEHLSNPYNPTGNQVSSRTTHPALSGHPNRWILGSSLPYLRRRTLLAGQSISKARNLIWQRWDGVGYFRETSKTSPQERVVCSKSPEDPSEISESSVPAAQKIREQAGSYDPTSLTRPGLVSLCERSTPLHKRVIELSAKQFQCGDRGTIST